MAANASSNGAKTVKGPAPFRFSFKPDLERDYSVFKDYLSDEMVSTFKKHRLL